MKQNQLKVLVLATALATSTIVSTGIATNVYAQSVISTDVEINAKISLNKTSVKLGVGEWKDQTQLKVKNTKAKVNWSSSDTSVAKVTKKGVVKAVGKGKAVITAKVGKKTLECKVSVYNFVLPQVDEQLASAKNCTAPVAFDVADINWEEGKVDYVLYQNCYFDGVEISKLKVGDHIINAGKIEVVIKKIEKQESGLIYINEDMKNGFVLAPAESGGIYYQRDYVSDFISKIRISGEKMEAKLAADVKMTDFVDFNEPGKTVTLSADKIKAHMEGLKDESYKDFNCDNTTFVFNENGEITEIIRIWTP